MNEPTNRWVALKEGFPVPSEVRTVDFMSPHVGKRILCILRSGCQEMEADASQQPRQRSRSWASAREKLLQEALCKASFGFGLEAK
eukprot:4102624-Amphidinium_carterae.1